MNKLLIRRLTLEVVRAGIETTEETAQDWTADRDCLTALAVLLGNRATNGQPSGRVPAALRAVLGQERLDAKAEAALRRAERVAT